jgi:transcriptional regulator with XRE-family HTH domain
MSASKPTLGSAIRIRRQEIGLTQEGLAERIGDGVRQSDVSRLERDGIQMPRAARLRAIAAALEIEPGELLTRAGWEGLSVGNPPDGGADGKGPQPIPPGDIRVEDDQPDETTLSRLNQALERARIVQSQFLDARRRYDRTTNLWKQHFGLGTDGQ